MTSRTEPGLASTWTYDTATKGVGKIATASADNGYSRSHSYDSLGRPSGSSITAPGAFAYSFSNSYDANGRLNAVNYPSGNFAVRHVYTSLGYLAEVRNDATNDLYWRADAQNAEGRLTQFTHGNGIATTQTYDANRGWMTAIQAGPSNSVQNLSYEYDALSNVLSRTDAVQSVTETFTYDAYNRVATAVIAGVASKTFQYNAAGNITYKSDAGTYTYNPPGSAQPHAVQSISGAINASYTGACPRAGASPTRGTPSLRWTPLVGPR
jgi:hypothetical protein